VVVRISLRHREVIQADSEPVALDVTGGSSFAGVIEAAGRLIKRLNVTDETIHCAVTGELAHIRKIVLPASVGRRLEQVLKFELDEVLPYDIEDAIFDYVETDKTSEDIVLLTATVLADKVASVITGLAEKSIAPREIGVDTFSYLNIKRVSGRAEDNEITAFVDIGHSRTNIAILDSTEPTVRTVLRGGRELTEKLSEAGAVDFTKAEIFKKEYGITGRVGEVLRDSLRPLVREIQQTFKGHLAAGGRKVTQMVLCGGGGLLLGLDRFLADALEVPVEIYELQATDRLKREDDPRGAAFALAYMLALREEVPRTKRIDVRRGTLAFKGDFEYLKRRVTWMAVCILAIIVSWIVASMAEYSALADRVENQRARLVSRTKDVFGKPITDHDKIEEALQGTTKEEKVPLPKKDAFDLVIELSKRIPPTVVHDIEQLEIKPKRVMIKGMVDADLKTETDEGDPMAEDGMPEGAVSPPPAGGQENPPTAEGSDLTPTDLIKQQLEAFKECFLAIRMGKVSTVNERRRYQMDIDSACP
jgi:general secretion pathway protein L